MRRIFSCSRIAGICLAPFAFCRVNILQRLSMMPKMEILGRLTFPNPAIAHPDCFDDLI